jgi:hypothetical protein
MRAAQIAIEFIDENRLVSAHKLGILVQDKAAATLQPEAQLRYVEDHKGGENAA